MKKNCLFFLIVVFSLTACQQKSATVPVNMEAEKAAVQNTLDQLLQGIKNQDINLMDSLLSEDLLACGTDPSEFWTKEEIMKLWKQMLSQGDLDMQIMGTPVIKVAPDGNSAIVVQQVKTPFTPNILWRNDYYLTKNEDHWTISFWSSALIPENKYLQTLNDAAVPEETAKE